MCCPEPFGEVTGGTGLDVGKLVVRDSITPKSFRHSLQFPSNSTLNCGNS